MSSSSAAATSLQLLVSQYTTQLQRYLDPSTAVALWDGLSVLPTHAEQAGFQSGPIFVSWVAVLHAIDVCVELFNNMHPETSLMHTWVAMIVLSFGGTTMASLLLSRVPGWIALNDPLAIYTAIYLLFRYTPLLSLANLIGTPLRVACAAADGIARALAITAFAIDTIHLKSAAPLANSIVACLVCGTLSGCGGGILNAVFGVTKRTWALGTPQVSVDVQLAAVVAAGYTFAVKSEVVDRATAQGVACVVAAGVLVLQVLTRDVRRWCSRSGAGGKKVKRADKPLPPSPVVRAAGKESPVPSPGQTPRKSAGSKRRN